MKLIVKYVALVCLAISAASPGVSLAADTDAQVAARHRYLEFVGAFTNDSYKIRDGYWVGKLEAGKPLVFEVNLYTGNSYWFAVAAGAPEPKLEIAVFDEAGNPVEGNLYSESGRAAAGIAPAASGPYYVKIQLTQGDPVDICFSYCFK